MSDKEPERQSPAERQGPAERPTLFVRPTTPIPDDMRALFLPDIKATHDGCPDNPTKIDKPFWKYMIAHGNMMAGALKKELKADPRYPVCYDEPGFTFMRLGRTETLLPDGRIVYIGGEYEDYPFPDFFIYNDVVVVRGHSDGKANAVAEVYDRFAEYAADFLPFNIPSYVTRSREDSVEYLVHSAAAVKGAAPEEIDIYGYPKDVFLPTDFHTATYYKDEATGKEYIYIIGGRGYIGSPHRHATITQRLDLSDFSIQRMETTGEAPPPVMQGYAQKFFDSIVFEADKVQYVLSLKDMRWTKLKRPVIFSEHPDFPDEDFNDED